MRREGNTGSLELLWICFVRHWVGNKECGECGIRWRCFVEIDLFVKWIVREGVIVLPLFCRNNLCAACSEMSGDELSPGSHSIQRG